MNFCVPRENILQFGLREGMKVGDLGAGSGHYALSASPIVGKEGKVYAIDIQEDVLKHIREEARMKGFTNIETIWGDLEEKGGTRLRDHTLDAVVISNTLFQVEHRERVVEEIKRIIHPGGKVLVIDWAGCYDGIGPSDDRVITEFVAHDLFISAGFHKVKDFRAGPHHYAIVFTAP
jgi:ubiquinone/menaquinone biosynthesis C-methylase UbiE